MSHVRGRFLCACLCLPLMVTFASAAENAVAIRRRMADIATRLSYGVSSGVTAYMYGTPGLAPGGLSLAPCILHSSGEPNLIAVLRNSSPFPLDSMSIRCGTRRRTITRVPPGGVGDLGIDEECRTIITTASFLSRVLLTLYGKDVSATFEMTRPERKAWQEMTFYFRNFQHRTNSLPDTVTPPPSTAPDEKPASRSGPGSVLVYGQRPSYPEMARNAGIEGTTQVAVLVGANGAVRAALVSVSSGNQSLDLVAVRAALCFVFKPPARSLRSRQTWETIPFRFSLR